MKAWRVVRSGGLELVVAGLLVVTMVYTRVAGVTPWTSLPLDVAALAAVVVAQRWPRTGIALTLAVLAFVLVMDPYDVGVTLYLTMLPVVTAVRKGEFPLASVATILNAAAGVSVSLRLSGDANDWVGAMMGWLFLYGVVWAVGLGMRAVARAAAARIRAEFREREIELAWDLHDSVARNLAILAMQANAVHKAGRATPEELKVIADQARLASQSVREVTQLLGGSDRTATPEITLREAVVSGTQELRRLGIKVQASLEILEMPDEVDRVGGRIMQEALHNVAKHGLRSGTCVVTVEVTPTSLDLLVTNPLDPTRGGTHQGLGLKSMKSRASSLGGSITSRRVRGSWVCEVSLPLQMSGERAVPQ